MKKLCCCLIVAAVAMAVGAGGALAQDAPKKNDAAGSDSPDKSKDAKKDAKKKPGMHEALFKKLDTNSDGILTRDEYLNNAYFKGKDKGLVENSWKKMDRWHRQGDPGTVHQHLDEEGRLEKESQQVELMMALSLGKPVAGGYNDALLRLPPAADNKAPMHVTHEDLAVATSPTGDELEKVNLKDAGLAALLAWLLPGLGHLYQGRVAKAVLFFVFIMGTFVFGLCLGGSSEVGWGRVVYIAWNTTDKRWHYLCQLGVGLPALPALIQAGRANHAQPGGESLTKPLWNNFMAPPSPNEVRGHHLDMATESTLHLHLNRFFELGTVFTMVAGLLNFLVIFDAWDGPLIVAPRTDDEPDEKRTADK